MKLLLIFILVIVTSCGTAQNAEHTNLKKGAIAEGYDVVSYFEGKAVKGDPKYFVDINGVKYLFQTAENKQIFLLNPSSYSPQYGGYCAYAMADGDKVDINPKTFEIRDGKLYLFYNSFGINTLDKWLEEGAESLKVKADMEWKELIE